ncbi:MAG: hypothetical protein ABIL58_14220 [Pseudomonadota bacterium]
MAYLCTGDLSADQFLSTIEAYPWPDDAVVVAFTPTEARIDKFNYNEAFLSATEQGRIFALAGEFQWRRIGTHFRAVYLGDTASPANLEDFSKALVGLSTTKRHLLLWGERTDTDAEWLEQQVPHRFSYPIKGTQFPRGRAALVIEDWSADAGTPQFSRYQGIVEVKGGL